MKRYVILVFLVLLFTAACSTYRPGISKDVNLPPADPQLLYRYLTEESRYDTWGLWPGKVKFYEGKPPHGALLSTYINEVAAESIRAKRFMADGAIIVKENYSPSTELAALTVMYKIKGYHKAAGDWFWAKYGPNGEVQKAGKVDGCINCHAAKKANDYIFTSEFVRKGSIY